VPNSMMLRLAKQILWNRFFRSAWSRN